MRTNNTSSNVQLSLFTQEGNCVKDTQNGNQQIAKLSTYLKTRGGLWRLLALFPDKTVTEALRLAPSVLTRQEPGRLAKADCYIKGVVYKQGTFIPNREEVAL